MENSYESLSSSLFISYDDIDSHSILTCRNCNNIPLFGIKYKKKNVYLEYICQNRHYECGKFINQYKKIKNFVLNSNHNKITKNLSTPYYCNSCLKHNKKIIGYCNTCFKNICEDYSKDHLKHKISFTDDFNVKANEIEEIKNKIQNAKNFLNFLNDFYEDLIKKIRNLILQFKNSYLNYKKINEFQIKFCFDIIENYEKLKFKEMINFEILYNLKNIIKFNNFKQNFNLKNNILNKIINFYNFTTNFNNFILKDSNLFLIEIQKKTKFNKKNKNNNKNNKNNNKINKNNKNNNKINKIDSNLSLKLTQFLFPLFIKNSKIFITENPSEILQYFKYIGQKKYGKFNGFGIATIDGMGKYIGNFENNLIFGIGKIYQDTKFIKNCLNLTVNYSNSFVFYTGEIFNYERKGFGILYYENFKYKGYFKNNFLNNFGILTNKKTHEKFIGTFKNEKKDGYFLLINKHKNVIFYQQYKNDTLIFSIAEFQNSNGTNIIGQTKSTNDLTLNGYAICKYKNNEEYEGFFSNGEKNGHGICKYSNGDKYYGNWKKNMRNGKGTLFKENGEIYEGNWKDDKKFGFGRIYLEEKKKFEGKFVNDLKEGDGIFYFSNGDVLNGKWKNDLIEGEAIYYCKNNNKYVKKNYVKGKFINCNN